MTQQNSGGRGLCIALIALGILTRLYQVGGPPLDHHGIRQFDTAAIALNFAEPGASILYPKVDWGGDTPGYAQTEFPIYQYVVGSLYRVFGPHESIARGVNIALYGIAAWILFGLGRSIYGVRAALLAVGLFSFTPLSWFFTRSIQPDTTAVLGSLSAVAFFWRWTNGGSNWSFLASMVGLTIAALIKPTYLCLGMPLLYMSIRRFEWRLFVQPQLWILAIVVFGCVGAWFIHAESLWDTYGNTLFYFYEFPDFSKHPVVLFNTLARRVFDLIATPPGIVFMIVGALIPQPGKNTLVLWWLGATLLPAALVTRQYYGHDYYLLPAVLPGALLFGYGIDAMIRQELVKRWVVVGACIIGLGLSYSQVRRWTEHKPHQLERVAFGRVIATATRPTDRLIAVTRSPYRPGWYQHRMSDGRYLDHDAADLYLSDRRGWSVGIQKLTPELLEDLRERGATHLFYHLSERAPLVMAEHPPFRDHLLEHYTPIDVGEAGALFDLTAPAAAGP